MTERKKKIEPTKSTFDFVDLLTGRIGKIAGLVTAIGGLVALIASYWKPVLGLLVTLNLYTPPEPPALLSCVQVNPLNIPTMVKYSEWENMKINLKVLNNCSTRLALYATFVRRTVSTPQSVLRVRAPHDDLDECKGRALQEPRCWDQKIIYKKGEEEWNVPLPPLEQLSNPRPVEKISIDWAVYDYEAPNKPPILPWSTATIEVHNDTVSTLIRK